MTTFVHAALGAWVACALAFGACARGDVRRDTSGAPPPAGPDERVVLPRAVGGGPRVTRDLVPVVEVPRAEAPAYVGAHVELTGVLVSAIASDRAFWAGDAPDRQILIVIDAQSIPRAERERIARIAQPHRAVTIVGTLREPPTEEGARRAFHLDERDAARMRTQPLYVHATKIAAF